MAVLLTINRGFTDVVDSYKRRPLWWNLAREDISDSFRRTLIGPIWILVSYTVFVLAIYFVLGRGEASFLAYIALGLLVWNFISEVVGQAPRLFLREAALVRGTTLPLSIYTLRLTGKSAIRLGFSLLPAVAFVYLTAGGIGPVILASAAGLLWIVLTAPAIVMVIAIVGALLPDIEFVVQNAIRILFFLSPVFWYPSGDGLRQALYSGNPITYYIDIVRAPVVDGAMPMTSWMVVVLLTICAWLGALYLLGRFRDRIVFLV